MNQENETLPAVIWEEIILDEKEPVKLTADLIREKSKVLTDLKIANIFDEKGYAAVKSATMKAVKTRTSIEKREKSVLAGLKTDYEAKKKEVTDYTAGLYIACREAQTTLENKTKAIDDARTAEAKKLADQEKERTEARENKMFELGMLFNGRVFSGYGYSFTKEELHNYTTDFYANLVVDIDGLRIEEGVTGDVKEQPTHNGYPGSFAQVEGDKLFNERYSDTEPTTLFDNIVYQRSLNGYIFILTKGQVTTIEGQIVSNDRIMDSGIYAQIIIF